MLHFLQRLVPGRKDETGASAVEYGLLVAAIAALIVVVIFGLGGVVKSVFTETCTEVGAKTTAGAPAECGDGGDGGDGGDEG